MGKRRHQRHVVHTATGWKFVVPNSVTILKSRATHSFALCHHCLNYAMSVIWHICQLIISLIYSKVCDYINFTPWSLIKTFTEQNWRTSSITSAFKQNNLANKNKHIKHPNRQTNKQHHKQRAVTAMESNTCSRKSHNKSAILKSVCNRLL